MAEKRIDQYDTITPVGSELLLIQNPATHPTAPLQYNKTAVSSVTPVTSVAGKTGAVTLSKTDIGLGNVDNTADTAKPVSASTQTALDSKQATLASGTNIKTINGNSVLGSGDLVVTGTGGADATASSKGILQLAGDLSGTATTPTVTTATFSTSGKVKLLYYNVMDYGAVGNGTTDDTAAIQSAITAVPTAGGTVFFPAGTYKLTSAITLKSNLRLIGSGKNASNLNQTSTSANGLSGTDITSLSITALRVSGPSSGTGIGISLATSTTTNNYISFENLNVRNFGGDGIFVARAIVTNVKDVVSQGHGGHGFNFDDGTSVNFTGCYALSCQQAGYRLNSLQYSAMSGCASDSNGIGYLIDTGEAISLNGCGCESTVNRSTSYPGTGFKITGGHTVGLYNCMNFANLNVAVWVTGSAASISLINFFENTPTGTATNSILVDSGCTGFVQGSQVTTAVNFNDRMTSIVPRGRSDFNISNSVGIKVTHTTGSATNTQPAVQAQGVDANNRAFAVLTSADTNNRWVLNADGKQEWGSGAATRDVTLYRSAADTLKTDDLFVAGLGLDANTNKIINVTDPTNLQDAATKNYVDTSVSGLVNSAPAALDTLNELATALGNDASFSTTVTNSLATKAPIASPTFTGTTTSAAEAITNTNGTLSITSVTDGGDFNIYQSTGGTKTLAIYGAGAATTHLNLLDGAFYTASTVRLSNAGVLQNVDLTGTGNTFPTFNQNTTGSAAKWTTARTLAGNSVDGSANVAFANKFIVQGTSDTGLSAAQFLGALSTGILKVTTTTGVLSTAVAADFPTLNQTTTGTAAGITGKTTPTGALVGDTDTQTLTNKNLTSGTNTFPTLNQNTTGTAANVTGTVLVANGGTGGTTAATARAGILTKYVVQFACQSSTPLASQTYFFGFPFDVSMVNTTAVRRQKVIPFATTLRGAAITVIATAGGSTNAMTVSARVNNTTDVVLSSAVQADQALQTYSVTGLSTAFSAGDLVEIKVTTPAWVTAPTTVRMSVELYFE